MSSTAPTAVRAATVPTGVCVSTAAISRSAPLDDVADEQPDMGAAGVAKMDAGDDRSSYLDDLALDEADELALDVSAAAVDGLLSGDKCLLDQMNDCGTAHDEDDDQSSMAGTFVGDDEGDDELLATSNFLPDEPNAAERPSLFPTDTDSSCSSFSMRETSIVSAAPQCTCGRSIDRRRDRVMSASEEYVDAQVRQGLHVRVVGIESAEMNSRFIIRVDDIETCKAWEVGKSTKEMAHFYNQIRHICMDQAPVKKEMWGTFRGLRKLRLPKKFAHTRGSLCYQRKVVYDSLLRHTAALTSPAPMGPRRRQVVLLLQEFLNVAQFCDVADREICNCWFFSNRVNASQLVAEIFSDPCHPINRECSDFVRAMTKKSHDTRRTRMYARQASSILRTIAKKMTEIKKVLLSDVTLLQQVGTLRHDMAENEFDDFVDDVRRAAAGFVQKAVLVELEDHVHEALHVLYSDDEIKLQPKLELLQTKPQGFFGIPTHLRSWNEWQDARLELCKIDQYSLPLDKLKCIVRAASAIFRACDRADVSTDEFIQIHFFVVVMSNLPHLLLTLHLLRMSSDQSDLTGEMGYYFTNFEAAIRLIEEHTE